jgi:twitching motility protein PilT
MRLTLNASETGHLVLATVHSSSCAEALQRVVSAFPAEIQSGVAAQVADSLLAVITQRLRFKQDINIRVPECEILMATHAVKNFIRNRDFFKIVSSLETGAEHGMWTFQRYRNWLDARTNWSLPGEIAEAQDGGTPEKPIAPAGAAKPQAFPVATKRSPKPAGPTPDHKPSGRIEIERWRVSLAKY